MSRRMFLALGVAGPLACMGAACSPRSGAAHGPVPVDGDREVTALLEPILRDRGVPALAAALIMTEGIVAFGAVGYRKRGEDVPVTLADQWHLGSDTKAMTAALAARLVEDGKLAWDTTIAETFPDLVAKFDPQMKSVTMRQLLSHRAGLPANLMLLLYQGDDVRDLRWRAVRDHMAQPPQTEPGTAYAYSNLGYIIAGAMIERITDTTWEESLEELILEPLGMKNTGHGGLGTPGQLDQPWGHDDDGRPVHENGPEVDNPPVMGPAGRVHCTMQDWALFIRDQLRGARGEPGLLAPESYAVLQSPWPGGDYALGWTVVERPWAGGAALTHGGSNTMNFANVWIAPKRGFAIAACSNQGGDTAFRATDDAVGAIIGLYEEQYSGSYGDAGQ